MFIEPKYSTLNLLFAERVFRIPKYQRFYSWERKQREDLLNDISVLHRRASDEHHFMATLVCFRTQEEKHVGAKQYRLYDVVDGQQRLTTLIILLKCIHVLADESEEERRAVGEILVKGDGNLVLLQTNNANEYLFHAFIKDGREPRPEEMTTAADHNLADAIKQCKQFVDEWKAKEGGVLSLFRLLMYRLGFVIYDTDSEKLVYSVFEILNSRGLAVDWLDKCKSVLMGKAFELAQSPEAAGAQVDRINDIWAKIYAELANKLVPGSEVLRVTATLRLGSYHRRPMDDSSALEEIRQFCSAEDNTVRVSEWILDATRKLVELRRGRLEPVAYILQSRLLAVAIMTAEYLSEEERARALEQWERVTFRIFGLFDKDSRTKVGEYTRLAIAVMSGRGDASDYDRLMISLRELALDHPIEDGVEVALKGTGFYVDNPARCRYVLWRYEEHLAREAGRGAEIDDRVAQAVWNKPAEKTIEHIFPQNPEPNGPWRAKMRRGAVGRACPVDDHVHRIGNLVLLSATLNEEARRQGFEQKKAVYRKQQLRMFEEVLACETWTLKEIEDRENRIMEWARGEWADL